MTREEYSEIRADLELQIERAAADADRGVTLLEATYQKGKVLGLSEALEIVQRVALGPGHGDSWDGLLT